MDKAEMFRRYFESEEGRRDFEEAAELVRKNDTDGLAKFILDRRYTRWLENVNDGTDTDSTV